MKIDTHYLLALLTVLTVSCENELPFSLKENPTKLVLNALINADSLNNTVFLHMTHPKQLIAVTNATVEVRVNGQLTETISASPVTETDQRPNRYLITSRFHPGEVVRMDALTPDGQYHAWAEVTVPQRPEKIEKVDTATVKWLTGYGASYDRMRYRITFSDRKGEPDYYRLIVEQRFITTTTQEDGTDKTQRYNTYNYIGREDVVLTDGQPYTGEDESNGMFEKAKNIYGIFDDSRFRDASYTMTVYNQVDFNYFEPLKYLNLKVVIRLVSITETAYYYLKALNVVDSDMFDEVLMEPIRYPSNVNGGIGIVCISTETSYAQDIIEQKFD